MDDGRSTSLHRAQRKTWGRGNSIEREIAPDIAVCQLRGRYTLAAVIGPWCCLKELQLWAWISWAGGDSRWMICGWTGRLDACDWSPDWAVGS